MSSFHISLQRLAPFLISVPAREASALLQSLSAEHEIPESTSVAIRLATNEDRGGIGLPRPRGCVLNRALIDRTTHQMISVRAPSDYRAAIRKTHGFPFDAPSPDGCTIPNEGWGDQLDLGH